jgi:transcriptional regulator with PAS, ATPase and Fis domain
MYIRRSLVENLKKALEIKDSMVPILIYGETGVGKEVLARLIHENSEKKGEFVNVLASCIPEALFESELFGHKKGAFTGAEKDKAGLLENANDGTLFIDEIAYLPFNLQAKFLGVLETGKFRRLGDNQDRYSRFHLICASNRDLGTLKEKIKFRRDLYFRIKGKIFILGPLRDENHEILPLLNSFLREQENEIRFSEGARKVLLEYSWPGNVRELRRFAELCPKKKIVESGDLPVNFFEIDGFATIKRTIQQKVHMYKRELIAQYLEADGDIRGLGEELGKSKIQARRILKLFNLKITEKRGRPSKNDIKNDKKGQ